MPSKFRGCIDLHEGQVKQIVGSTLDTSSLITNFTSPNPPSYFANLYKTHGIVGSHCIMLGHGNEQAALSALATWPNSIQIGGGINTENAAYWIEHGASKVIVTSFLFPDAVFSLERLQSLNLAVGKDRLVVDLSCKRRGNEWVVAMDKWTRLTDVVLSAASIEVFQEYCSEFLVHAADVEGKCEGIDEDLVVRLSEWCGIPCTYAGGARNIKDLKLVDQLSGGAVDLTFGSALDIFGGKGVTFEELVDWNNSYA